LLQQLDGIYVPQDEKALRRLQRNVDDLDRKVRAFAQDLVDVLPKGLSLIDDETYILGLFLAQQKRLNLEIDAENPPETVRSRLGRVLPFLAPSEAEAEVTRAAHRTVAARLESDIDRACLFFCQDHGIPPISDETIDWRVAIRYLGQELHRLAGKIDLRRDFYNSPQRFEIALVARDLAANIADKRRLMVAAQEPSKQSV
jgi:hypothetical protein